MSTPGSILLSHGSGGSQMHELLRTVFLPAFDNPILRQGNDGAVLDAEGGRLVFSTDSHVVRPLHFPGGSIGTLAVHGTINDLAMMGARPLALSAAFIIQEGFRLEDLKRIVDDMGAAAREAGVPIVTGDTKVVEREAADGLFITTAGIGWASTGCQLSGDRLHEGDAIVLSGPLGNHGIAVASCREGIGFHTPVVSDTRPLHHLVEHMLSVAPDLRVLRDPTRGGLATTLNELAAQSGCALAIEEDTVPVDEDVRGACALLGFDPLYLTNEGILVAVVPDERVEDLLGVMRARPEAPRAVRIGTVVKGRPGMVTVHTSIGGTRVLPMLSGEILPRIC